MNWTNRVRAALAPGETDDGDADPQAQDDERAGAFAFSHDINRAEPETGDIEDWVDEYQENPLIRVPTLTFTSDILEPGVRVAPIDEDDEGDLPEVSGAEFEAANGERLDDALEEWLAQSGIVDGEFGHSLRDVLDKMLKDAMARRGTALVEVVYDDAAKQNRIMGFRPFRVETVTAYTREAKSILLRPDDTAEDADLDADNGHGVYAMRTLSGRRKELPKTKAGDTAAYVQFDDAFGVEEEDEVAFAQDDVVKYATDADTGDIFGLPYTASVYDRASSLRQQYADLDHALKATAYQHFVAEVNTNDEAEAKDLLDGFDPSNPEKVNVVNYGVDVQHFSGESPTIDATLKQEIEWVLSAFPVPIYRVGFEGDINRDVTSEQSDDYQRELSEWRERLTARFRDALQRKADEWMGDDAPQVELKIEPKDSDNPLEDDQFDAEAFSSAMAGIKKAAPGGAVEQIIPPHEVREKFLGLDPEPPEPPDGMDAQEELPPETDPRVRETFDNAFGEADDDDESEDDDGPEESDDQADDQDEDDEGA